KRKSIEESQFGNYYMSHQGKPVASSPYFRSRKKKYLANTELDTELDPKTRSNKGPGKARQAPIKKQDRDQRIKSTYKTFPKRTKTHTKAVDQDQLQVQEPILKIKALEARQDPPEIDQAYIRKGKSQVVECKVLDPRPDEARYGSHP
ncbi:2858_t:CDS:2, partial [Gigaspora rosea]